jgi:hypothetical protein
MTRRHHIVDTEQGDPYTMCSHRGRAVWSRICCVRALILFTLLSLLISLAEPYRPYATQLGVLVLHALAIVAVSSWLRLRRCLA